MDLHSRRIVGWAVSDRLKKELVLNALGQAVALRAPPKGLIHHWDRGSQYCSIAFRKALETIGAMASMSGKGNCYDNAVVEAFFKTIKSGVHMALELLHQTASENGNCPIYRWILQPGSKAFSLQLYKPDEI